MANAVRSLVLVTGAASGLGFELAKRCAENGFDLVIAGAEPEIQLAAQEDGERNLAEIAWRGFRAMMDDDAPAAGWRGKLRVALSHATFDPLQSRHSH